MVHGLETIVRQNELASSTHTPGPWRAGRNFCVVADVPVPDIGGSDAVSYYGGHLICESIAKRNVPIVAAAPELLEAVQELLSTMERIDSTTAEYFAARHKVKVAVAKATGRPCPT